MAALERLRESHGAVFDRSMWDFSMFHPTAWGHEQLATEAYALAERFPGLLAPKALTVHVKNVKGDLSVERAFVWRWVDHEPVERGGGSLRARFEWPEGRLEA